MEVLRSDLVAVFQAVGFKSARKWDDERLLEKITELEKLAADSVEPEDEDLSQLFERIVDAGADDVEIVSELSENDDEEDLEDDDVEDDQEEEEEEEEFDPELQAAMDEVNAAEAKMEEQKATMKEAKKLLRKKKAEIKKKSGKGKTRGVPGPDVGNPARVNSLRNRLFFAGKAIKKVGVEAGITDEVIQMINELAGKENDKASMSQASFAWHGINGYVNGE